TYGYDGAARLFSVTSSQTGNGFPANLLSGTCTAGGKSGACFNALGKIVSDTLGDGETESWAYDKRGRVASYSATLNSNTIYSFSIPTYAPNSDILAANDSVNGNWTYTYDAFNRLLTSNKTNAPTASYSYVYDRFGNRLQQNPGFSATFANNRIDGYSYDAAGNLLSDGVSTYSYDAENRLISFYNTAGSAGT